MKRAYALPFILLASLIFVISCDGDVDPAPDQLEIPDTYTFTRNGESTVDFSGQTDRLNMLSEIKTYLTKGDAGEELSAAVLSDMFANENTPFESADLNASTKKLEDKTFLADVDYFKELFAEAASASADVALNQTEASQGVSGRLRRGTTENYILVNEKGWEYTQFVEKGLMGSVFFHQIFNAYLTDEKIGSSVDNVTLEEGKSYTAREHHFDEAFGYWGVPVDFPVELPAESRRFWASYTYGRSPLTNSSELLKGAFLTGRTAIVNNDEESLSTAVDAIYAEFEIVTVATAIHYLNDAKGNLNDGDIGNLFHHLSETYMFIRALRVHPTTQLSQTELSALLENGLGQQGDFWTVDAATLESTRQALIEAYPQLADIADQL